ncbi:hypothetical protein RIF29_32267 [Crotalaria pallida]|uniref:BURP domain-containing protein n=1 Tax=Crotalaria pallida TaxID=3830 RepID=A0AAN9HY11_CROPI
MGVRKGKLNPSNSGAKIKSEIFNFKGEKKCCSMHESRKMGGNFISCFLFLLLLIIMCSYGSRAEETALLKDHQTKSDEHTHAHFHTHMDHIDPSLMVFFTLKDLNVGKRMPIYFPKRDPATSPKLWPREKSDSLPFSLNQLPYLLKLFSFSPNSPQAKAMEDTLRECESEPIKGEVKFCATSYESMLEFTQSMLGLTTTHIQAFSTSHKTKSSVTFQNYTFLENIVEIQAPKMVACHTMPYPYAVFYCHSQESENKVYKISLVGDNGDKVEAMVVCHLDTSQWGASHISFQVLGVKPGSSSVCHFFPADNLIWVPKLQSHDFSAL